MKSTKYLEQLRQLGDEALRARETEMREQLFRMRFQLGAGQVESARKIRAVRKDLARLLTLEREREAERG